jgi:signal transduction histidine kinase
MPQHSGTGPRPPSGPVPAFPAAARPTAAPPTAARPAAAAARAVRAGLAWRGRPVAWARRHPLVVDSALVVVLVLLSPPVLVAGRLGDPAGFAVVVAGLLVPLVWRRRVPFAVFLAVAAAAFAQWLFLGPMDADLALFIAFYTVAAYQRPRQILIAAGLLEAGAVLAAVRYAPPGFALWSWVFITGTIAAAGFLGYNIRTRRAYLAALEDRAARLERERDQQAQLAASAERARIAHEIHDIIAHNLAVMIALADGAAYTAPSSLEQAVSVMGQVSATGRSALTDMRRLLGVMREPAAPGRPAGDPRGPGEPGRPADFGQPAEPGPGGEPGAAGERAGPAEAIPAASLSGYGPASGRAPQPMLADLDGLLATVRGAGLAVRLSESGSRPAAPAAQLAAYRIIQESLTNTLKHARATSARVRITYQPQAIELDLTDDGRPGGPVTGAGPGPGHGLAGMSERAAVFGGTVTAGPRPGGGWRVHATLNLDRASDRVAGPSRLIAAEGG